MKYMNDHSESGFSLIELLTIMMTLAILTGLSVYTLYAYKQSAEMAKGDSVYHTARTKMAISELDLPEGYMLALTASPTDGSLITGQLADVLPAMSAGKQVRLSVALAICDSSSDPLDLNQLIVVEPCLAQQKVQWTKFCGGIEVMTNRMINPAPCAAAPT